MKAMILAAGKGTRLKPFTDEKPKVLFPVEGFTLLELAIRFLRKHQISEFIVNVHHHGGQVIDYLEKNNGFGMKYSVSDERENLLDTGGAIVKAKKFFEGEKDFVLMGADILTELDLTAMIEFHRRSEALATLAVKDRPTSRSLLFDSDYRLTGWRNNSTGETRGEGAACAVHALGFSVVHVISTAVFDLISEKGAFPIMELYLRLMYTQKILGFRHDQAGWIEFGRGDRMQEIFTSQEFKRMINLF